jgi:hypothetical protein
MLVPATWQHDVVNLEETISINHNWITSSNVDGTWQYLQTEMISIHEELQQWQDGSGGGGSVVVEMHLDMECCENMLRGCVGLDVSSFFFMVLVRLIQVCVELFGKQSTDADNYVSESTLLFDLFRLTTVLEAVVGIQETTHDEDHIHPIQLRERLIATLQSEDMAHDAISMAKSIMEWVSRLSASS